VEQASVPGTQTPALFSKGAAVGAGVTVTGIARLNDSLLDAQVRQTSSTSGYWDAASSAVSTVETSLNEPGTSGLSSSLNDFWADWQTTANSAGSTSATSSANVLIAQGQLVASQISSGYTAAQNAWSDQRSATAAAVTTINSTAQQIATLNKAILQTSAAGGNANELMDQRDTALNTLSQLAGTTSRQNSDGTIDVLVDGNALVAETSARSLQLAGTTSMAGAGTDPVRVQWVGSGSPAAIGGGSVAAQLATLAGPNNGSGGIYAEAAQKYNDVATALAGTVNAALAAGYTPSGTKGASFFALGATGPAALSLTVVPTSADGIALNSASGTTDGAVADAVSQLGTVSGGADDLWAGFVSNVGVQSKNAAMQSTVADSAATAATNAQTSQSGVDIDEETTNLVTYQHAYQAAARVMTTVDSILDTLINHTGLTV
jgi:flagellar hook-associated protein 1 FlgK